MSPSPLDVSVDVSAVPDEPVGAGRYTVEIVKALAARHDLALQLLTRRDDAERWKGLGEVVPLVPTARPVRLLWEQTTMPAALARLGVAAHLAPHYTMPARAKVPKAVTIHDLTFFDHPELHERAKVPFFKRAIRTAAAKADALICVSQATADRLQDVCPPGPGVPVHVIPHGVDHETFRPPSPALDAEDAELLGALGARAPYLAFVGTIEPRKGVPTLVAAFDRIAAAHPDLTLVVAGRDAWGAEEATAAIAASPNRERIVRPGYLPGPAIPALFRHAAAVAYPSRAEGFGLPALEALACGAPLVTTRGSAMDEVVGEAALLVPPGDADELAGALEALVAEPEPWRQRGPAQAAAFTWERSAAAHAAVLKSVSRFP